MESLGQEKINWLATNEVLPVTEEVLKEYVGTIPLNETQKEERLKELKDTFSYYKRYGDIIMLYSTKYLEETNIKKLEEKQGYYNRLNTSEKTFANLEGAGHK